MPAWLNWLAIASLSLAFLSAAVIAGDLIRHPQKMAVMNPVWPLTAPYLGPLAVLAYWTIGRRAGGTADKPHWMSVSPARPIAARAARSTTSLRRFYFLSRALRSFAMSLPPDFATAYTMNAWLIRAGVK